MKLLFTNSFFFIVIITIGQNSQLEKIENDIKAKSLGHEIEKQIIDLNNDGRNDVIYLYQYGEPKGIIVYLDIDGNYKEVINEVCAYYELWSIDNNKVLYITQYTCCGESPFFSNRLFQFTVDNSILKENYVLTNRDYTGNTPNLTPLIYLSNSYYVKNIIDNYNLRISPSIDKFDLKNFYWVCEEKTNIITKLKINSKIKVLAELIERDRKWLFVEIENSSITTQQKFDSFFKEQKLRGWISGNYVQRI